MNLLDGKLVSKKIKDKIKNNVYNLAKKPCLAVIIVGDDPASKTYVKNKITACEYVGMDSATIELDSSASESKVLEIITSLNKNDQINGILVQLPLPKHINKEKIIEAIDPLKDVDCFHPYNIGKLFTGNAIFKPCTPQGVIEILNHYNIPISGKKCVVIGRSDIVGKPMSLLMLAENATVTTCHSKTENLSEITKQADIIISAIGKINFITNDMIKQDAVVIDVGINRNKNNKLCGDVDFENVNQKCSYITPVPGGCGPLTIAILLQNTLTAYKLQQK